MSHFILTVRSQWPQGLSDTVERELGEKLAAIVNEGTVISRSNWAHIDSILKSFFIDYTMFLCSLNGTDMSGKNAFKIICESQLKL